ncbi:MAG: LysE family translocator [Chitinophagales bacterium]|nr:LysE family translocator [Chitinophagales bacterium]
MHIPYFVFSPDMPKIIRIFFIGMLVSFLGSLPLGTLNIAAMQISISEGVYHAMLFSIGSLLVEVIYVRISLVAVDWIRKQKKILRILEWVTFFIVLALAVFSFVAAMHPSNGKNIVLSSTLPKLALGAVMSAVNPMQIPFWFGWSTILFSKNILLPKSSHYNSYIFGIGLGTFAGNCVFIFGGRLIVDKLTSNQSILSWVIGGIFAVTAVIQLIRILIKKDPIHQLHKPEEVVPDFEKKLF